jgi:1-deoxy-D-xylulose-5-phosphate synthase
VTFVLDRAGATGNDGPSHHGMWDLSLLGLVPGLRVAAPRDAGTLRSLFAEAVDDADGPTALRFPKGRVGPPLPAVDRWGRADVLREAAPDPAGPPVLIVAVGAMATTALAAAADLGRAGVPVTVVDPGWLLPVDTALVAAAARHRLVVTVEDNGVAGGYGDAFARALRAAGVGTELLTLGLPQRFLPHGDRDQVLSGQGLDVTGVVTRVCEALRATWAPVRPLPRRGAQDSLRASVR